MTAIRNLVIPLALAALPPGAGADSAALEARHPGAGVFVDEMVADHGLDRAWLEGLLLDAEKQDSIIEAMDRPAESKPWHEYRKIFLTRERVEAGQRFLDDHRLLLAALEQEYGVPPEVVTAIIGVETFYGRITGRTRVVDALATLSFHYPRRSAFFRREFRELLLLSRDEALPVTELRGSYAGAMGLGQFIPSSYRAYAVDRDGDGRRDLWGSQQDAIASVANYFARHQWSPGAPVTVPARVAGDARALGDLPIKPQYPVHQLTEWGYAPSVEVDDHALATVIELEGANGPEHWIGFHNFYVITRYNRSPLYAMAVHQLSRALAAGETPGGAP